MDNTAHADIVPHRRIIGTPTLKAFLILVNIISSVILYWIMLTYTDVSISTIGILSLITIAVNISILILSKISLQSIIGFFLIGSYLFHLGQPILSSLGLEDFSLETIQAFSRVGLDDYFTACFFAIIAHNLLVIGFVISSYFFKLDKPLKLNIPSKVSDETIFKIGLAFFIISVIPTLYIDYNKWLLYLHGSYSDTYKFFYNGWISILTKPFMVSLLLMMIGKRKNQKVALVILILSSMYMVFMMFKGNRASQVIFLFIISFVYLKLVHKKKMKPKSILGLGIAGYFGVAIIDYIGSVRSSGLFGISSVIDGIAKNLNGSAIASFIDEMGCTLISLAYSVAYFPSFHAYNFGKTYLIALTAIYPNFGGALGSLVDEYSFTNSFPEQVRQFLGGSYLGEAYFNFGFTGGLIGIILIGVFISSVSNILEKSILEDNILTTAIVMTVLPGMLIWLRGTFYGMVFDFVWFSIAIIILKNFFEVREKRLLHRANL